MRERKIDILGIAETHLRGKKIGEDLGDGFTLLSVGVEEGRLKAGVAIIIGPLLQGNIKDSHLINERIIEVTLKIKTCNLTILQVYAPQQGRPAQEKIDFYDQLEDHINQIPPGNKTVIIGDFNGRVGKERTNIENVLGPFGEQTRNEEGEMLIDFCLRNNMAVMNGFFKHRESHKMTRYRWNRNVGQYDHISIIDYILSSDKRMVNDVKVMPNESLDSDHRLLIADLNLQTRRAFNRNVVRKIKVENLLSQEHLTEYFSRCQEVQSEDWNSLKDTLLNIATDTLGVRYVGGTRKRRTAWWNEEVSEISKRKNRAYRRWLKEKTQESREFYIQIRRQATQTIRRAKKQSWEAIGQELNEDIKSTKKKIYKLAKTLRKPQENRCVFKNERGELTSDPEEINETWTNHFQQLLNVQHEHREEQEEEDQEEYQMDEELDISYDEMETAFRDMVNGKAPGPDELPIELLKEAPQNIKNSILEILNTTWNEGRMPEEWGKSIICPIHKKGDRNMCGNYRGISLMPHICKLYERIIEKRARLKIEPILDEWQHAYRKIVVHQISFLLSGKSLKRHGSLITNSTLLSLTSVKHSIQYQGKNYGKCFKQNII